MSARIPMHPRIERQARLLIRRYHQLKAAQIFQGETLPLRAELNAVLLAMLKCMKAEEPGCERCDSPPGRKGHLRIVDRSRACPLCKESDSKRRI